MALGLFACAESTDERDIAEDRGASLQAGTLGASGGSGGECATGEGSGGVLRIASACSDSPAGESGSVPTNVGTPSLPASSSSSGGGAAAGGCTPINNRVLDGITWEMVGGHLILRGNELPNTIEMGGTGVANQIAVSDGSGAPDIIFRCVNRLSAFGFGGNDNLILGRPTGAFVDIGGPAYLGGGAGDDTMTVNAGGLGGLTAINVNGDG